MADTVHYQGNDYKFDLYSVPTEELREIKRKTGMTVRQFIKGITEVDVDAMAALKWVVLRSDGQHDDLVLLADDPFPDYWQFLKAWNDRDKPDEEADPTQAGSLPATSTPASSESTEPASNDSPPTIASPSPTTAESLSGGSGGSPTGP